jgi:general secretion pathway protein A
MYVSYFGLREYPFGLTSDPRFFYSTIPYQMAYTGVQSAICERKGFILLTGEPGTGKTTLLRRLMLGLADKVHLTSLPLATPSLEEVLSYLCHHFSLSSETDDWALQLAALREHLYTLDQRGENAAVLLDEAQNLDNNTLDRLRALLSLQGPHGKLLQIVLAGQPELEEKLSQPELQHIWQRVEVHQRLLPLPKQQVGPYIQHRLQVAGCTRQDLFTPDAVRQVIRYSRAIPRLVNVICDNALFSTYRLALSSVSAETIMQVAQDLALSPAEEDSVTITQQVNPIVIPTAGKGAVQPIASGLRFSPFRHTTDIRFFYPNAVYEEAYRALLTAIREQKALMLVTGEAGTGKTSLLQLLADSIETTFHITTIPSAPRSFEELMRMICQHLSVRVRGEDVSAQIRALDEFLSSIIFRTEILVIDDAHRLSSEALEHLRLLLTLKDLNRNLLPIILVGRPELETTLAQMDSHFLQEHIATYCRLTPLAPEEVGPFIHHRLSAGGWGQREIFSPNAITNIVTYSQAIPRRINNLCEYALQALATTRQKAVSADIIEQLAHTPHFSDILDASHIPQRLERRVPTIDPRQFTPDRHPLTSFRRALKWLRKGIFFFA